MTIVRYSTIFCMLALATAAQAAPAKAVKSRDAASTQPIEKSAARVRLAYGDDWEVVPSAKLPPQTVAMVTHKGDSSVTIKTTSVGPLDHHLSLKDIVTGAVAGTKQKMQDFKLIEQVETTLDGRPATRLLYEGHATGGVVRAMQFYTVESSMCYIVTYAAPADRFEKYTKPAEQVIATFRVGGPRLAAATAPATKPASSGELETYSPLAGGYTIRYPADWDVMPAPLSTVAVLFREGSSDSGRPATVSVSKPHDVASGTALDDLVSATEAALRKQFPDVKVLKKGPVKLAGENGSELVIEGTFKGHSPARMAEQFVIVKGVLYHLNFTTAPAAYDRLRPLFERMAATFEVSAKQ